MFFVGGNVKPVARGLKNAQRTALALLGVALPMLLAALSHRRVAPKRRKDMPKLVAARRSDQQLGIDTAARIAAPSPPFC